MNRAERLLDLVALLLDAKRPVPFAAIRTAFPDDYAGSPEAAERKFERDKSELLELGVPVVYRPATDETAEGYEVDPNAYALPALALAPEELAVLSAAGAAALASEAFPAHEDLAHALRKLAFLGGAGAAPRSAPAVRLELGSQIDPDTQRERLETLWTAVAARKSIELTYASPAAAGTTRRRVDPYGLVLRGGVWTLVGHCHLRGAVRSFLVHRVLSLSVNTSRPRTPDFSLPDGFSASREVASTPWEHRLHPPVEVDLVLRGPLARLASQLFPGAELDAARSAPETARLRVSASSLDGLLRFVLTLGPDAAIVAPPAAVERLRAMLERVAAAHSLASPGAGNTSTPSGASAPSTASTLLTPPPEPSSRTAPTGEPEASEASSSARAPRGARRRRPPDSELERAGTESRRRLRRLLLLVPYVVQHPGSRVDAVAAALGASRAELLADLDLLSLVGRPPFQPDDYIDIFVEDDRVRVELDQRLSRPPRFTVPEAAALAAAARLIDGAGTLGTAAAKLEAAVPQGAVAHFRALYERLDLGQGASPDLPLLTAACAERREVAFDYFTASRGTVERRTVRPWTLTCRDGVWYLSGYCTARGDERLFRVDRMSAVTPLATSFEPPPERTEPVPRPRAVAASSRTADGQGAVRVRFTARAAPYAAERFGGAVHPLADGGAELLLSGAPASWLAPWVLSFGGEAAVLEPAWAIDAVARAAQAGLAGATAAEG